MVITAKLRIHSPLAWSFQFSQMTAMPNGEPSSSRCGRLFAAFGRQSWKVAYAQLQTG